MANERALVYLSSRSAAAVGTRGPIVRGAVGGRQNRTSPRRRRTTVSSRSDGEAVIVELQMSYVPGSVRATAGDLDLVVNEVDTHRRIVEIVVPPRYVADVQVEC